MTVACRVFEGQYLWLPSSGIGRQVEQGIEDTGELFRKDSLKSGGGLSDEPLIDTVVAYAR